MKEVQCRLIQVSIRRGDGRKSLNLPFPFYSKGRERKGDGLAGWKTGKKERRQRTPADVAFIFRGTSAQKPNRLNEAANKRIPARGKDSGGVGGLQGKSRMRILASALGACLTRQAGFAAARPAASGGLWQEIRDQ